MESELAQRYWQEGGEKRDEDTDLQSGGGRVSSDRLVRVTLSKCRKVWETSGSAGEGADFRWGLVSSAGRS